MSTTWKGNLFWKPGGRDAKRELSHTATYVPILYMVFILSIMGHRRWFKTLEEYTYILAHEFVTKLRTFARLPHSSIWGPSKLGPSH